jgi:hypothetical protein
MGMKIEKFCINPWQFRSRDDRIRTCGPYVPKSALPGCATSRYVLNKFSICKKNQKITGRDQFPATEFRRSFNRMVALPLKSLER